MWSHLGFYTMYWTQFRNPGSHNMKNRLEETLLKVYYIQISATSGQVNRHIFSISVWLRETQSSLFPHPHMNCEIVTSSDEEGRTNDVLRVLLLKNSSYNSRCQVESLIQTNPSSPLLCLGYTSQGPGRLRGEPCSWPQKRAEECGSQPQGAWRPGC